MTAGQDEARAREIVRKLGCRIDPPDAAMLVMHFTAALTEVRDQGAIEEREKNERANAFADKVRGIPFTSPEGMEAAMNRKVTDAPSPALAPLREAVVQAAMGWFDADDYGEDDAKIKMAEACAALSRAQPPTTEDLT